MNKYQAKKVNSFLPDILINEESKDKLFSFATSHNLSELEHFITTNSISLHVQNNNNQTIMHVLLAAESITNEEELLRCVKLLVERGAPISSIDKFNLTPLFICIKKNYPLIFTYLLEKGASLDINTYDNLTVLHVLTYPDYSTHNSNGIQNLVPEKLPKIKMEDYEYVYKEIEEIFELNFVNNKDGLNIDVNKFKTIAMQFYYPDDREDFNNTLLKEDYKDTLYSEKKTDIFEKIKSKLNIFYTNDAVDNIDENELNEKLNIIKLNLNKKFKQAKMIDYNEKVLKAIKSLAHSLELSIHIDHPTYVQVATNVVIEIAESAITTAAAAAAAAAFAAVAALANIGAVRAAIQLVKATEAVPGIKQDIIDIIKTATVQAAVLAGAQPLAVQAAAVHAAGVLPVGTDPVVVAAVQATLAVVIVQPPFVQTINVALRPIGPLQQQVLIAIRQAISVVIYIKNVKTTTENALIAVHAVPGIQIARIAAIAVVQTAIRAIVFATVYIINQANQLENIEAVHVALQAEVQNATLPAGVNLELTQQALTYHYIAVEAVLTAAATAAYAAYAAGNIVTAPVNSDIVIEAVRKALEYIDDLEKTHIATNVVIAIAEAARVEAITRGDTEANIVIAVVTALKNIDATRAAVQSVVSASTTQGTNKEIIDLIQKTVVTAAVTAAINAHIGAQARVDIDTALGQPAIKAAIKTAVKLSNILVNADEFLTAVKGAIVAPAPFTTAVDTVLGPVAGVNQVVFDVGAVLIHIKNVKIRTGNTFNAIVNGAGVYAVPAAEQAKVIAVVRAATRAAVFAAVYRQNTVNQLVAIEAVHIAVQAEVQAATRPIGVTKAAEQTALTEQVVAVEAVLASAKFASLAVFTVERDNPTDVISSEKAIKEALALPQIIPNFLKNTDYNKLRKSYKLMNIPQKYLNYNTSYQYNNNNNNIKSLVLSNNYKLPEGERSYSIDYFNLLHTFNEYARNNIQLPNIDDDIFILYQCIQQIYKYNYITYIFDIEKKKIVKLNDNIKNVENKNLFDKNFKELEKSIESIREQLKKIEDLANEYIDIYNKRNGYKIFANPNTLPIYIGIYPKIKFPKLTNNQPEMYIKYTLGEENAKIAECNNDYSKYNKHKNDFFHNFVLYFQDIGIINGIAGGNLLNGIQNPINYDIIIDTNHNIYNEYEMFKVYKLYFYDPIYLKLEKQNIIKKILVDDDISEIKISNFEDFFNADISNEFNNKLKTQILNEILEKKFNTILKNEINNFLNINFSKNDGEIYYDISIKEPDIDAILLQSLGFTNILIPNYEFTNNKFLSISKNRFLKCILYFDINYFKSSNISTLKYYKENKFITEILKNHKSLLFKTDIKGWTPIYYAIDGNNYKVIEKILEANNNTLIHYDHKKISPLQLCINKQLNHLNYLLTEKDGIHYLNNYINMLRNELESNKILIPLNIEAVFIIALFIQNHIWSENATGVNLKVLKTSNTRQTQINKEYNDISTSTYDVDNNKFKYKDKVDNKMVKPDKSYTLNPNINYNYNDDDNNKVFKKYYDIAKQLEEQDFGLYGSYWKNYNNNNNNKKNILDHINQSIELKTLLQNLGQIEKNNNKFNLPFYDKSIIDTFDIKKIKNIKTKLEHYLKFINIRFNTNKNNAYVVFLDKIYVHALANIIGVDFYLTMEELIVKYYINKNATITIYDENNVDNIKEKLLIFNNLLINNKLDKDNINYLYISKPNPELILKEKMKEVIKKTFLSFDDGEELISMYETVVLPRYRDLYKITYKYLQMFISNYHKFIYNQYHGLEILLLLFKKLGDISS